MGSYPYMKLCMKLKKREDPAIFLKLDFEKAYDKVSWPFLIACIQARGFCDKWIEWIKQVLYKGTVCIKLNNMLGPHFQSHKGVRQEDAPYPHICSILLLTV